MGGTAKIKEAVMYAAAATQQHIAGDAGVKATGNQRQHIFLRADRETAQTFVARSHQRQTILFNFKIHRHVRVFKLHAGAFNMLVQTAANIALYIL